MGLWPRVTARRAYRGRERLVRAFEEWIAAGGYEGEDVPEIVRRRVRIAREHGLGDEAVARSEVSFLFAGIVNTATTMFWTLVQVFARRELRDVVRCEVMGCVTVVDEVIEGSEDEEEDDDRKRGELSLEKLKRFCPTLMAVVKECLRLGSDNYSVRFVKTDTDLAGGEYRLKAGSVVQIAGGVIHADAGIWGENVDEFDHTRFLKTQQNGNGKGQAVEESQGEDLKEPRSRPQVQQTLSGGVHPAAFRAFGGGKTLCPGRHFAMNEILACVAVLVLAFDIEAADGSGQIKIPPKNDGVLPVHILEPTVPVKVVIRPRHDAPRIEVV
jgi:cytochrome P450